MLDVGTRIVKQGDTEFRADVIHPELAENPIPQVIRERVGLLEDLVQLRPRDVHPVSKVRRKDPLSHQLVVDELLVLFLLAFAERRVTILAAVVLFGVTIGNALVMQPLLIAEKFGTREYGRIYSMSQLIATAGVAGGPVAVGVLYDLAGNYFWPFIMMSLATFAGLAIMIFGTRR